MAGTSQSSRHIRWTVPGVDVSVLEWLNAQTNVQHSLRQLVRESIEADGYIDVVYRPIRQREISSSISTSADAQLHLASPTKRAAPAVQETSAERPTAPTPDPAESPALTPAQTPPASQPQSAAAQSEKSRPTQREQVSMDEIMAATRR